jgi:hypothetical protein
MAKNRVFISYDYDRDEVAKIMFAGQAKLEDSLFDFKNASLKGCLSGDWKVNVQRRMDNTDVVIVLGGESTNTATGVAAELEIANEKKKDYFLLATYIDKSCTKQSNAQSLVKDYKWTWDNLKALLGGSR